MEKKNKKEMLEKFDVLAILYLAWRSGILESLLKACTNVEKKGKKDAKKERAEKM